MANSVSLSSILVPNKNVTVEYPGMPGFKIDISFLSRESLQAIKKKSTKVSFKNRQPVEEMDDDLFLSLYVEGCVKNWTGLTFAYLEQLAPIDAGANALTEELVFSKENALALMKASTNFDAFISEQVTDLGNFSKGRLNK